MAGLAWTISLHFVSLSHSLSPEYAMSDVLQAALSFRAKLTDSRQIAVLIEVFTVTPEGCPIIIHISHAACQ